MSNLYAAPSADMTSPVANSDTYVPKMFQLNGRIGRVRYLVYASVISLVMTVAIGGVLAVLSQMAGFMALVVVGLLMWIPMFVILFYIIRRRLHDLGKSGWFALLQFIPLVNLVFVLWILFGRGNEGSNEYGPAPAPNTRPLVIAAWLIPLAMVASMPSYLKFEDQMVKKMMGGGASDADMQKMLESQADVPAAVADMQSGSAQAAANEAAINAASDTATDAAAATPAPAEPKAAN
ncbi:DUF805 domain-containing protein [Massilia genomosp. 1]|uniref:DUF805 domain-containing protein n=1 Tax=Massilia genomosp. 1 TaxID=2609280 RepID=A0ABX0MU65_9BURK|nr:DUF805 domain-containing protein [Massilia genomosp. 1]NHZ65592.1 DUF805 domain-containing protein [Massilia genomosp. 1]